MVDDNYIKEHFIGKTGAIKPISDSSLKSKFPEAYSYLLTRYDDISQGCFTIKEVLFRIKNGIERRPVCEICGGPAKFKGKINSKFPSGYTKSCLSESCYRKESQARAERTMLLRHGVKSNLDVRETRERGNKRSASDHAKDARRLTMLERYGVEFAFHTDCGKVNARKAARTRRGIRGCHAHSDSAGGVRAAALRIKVTEGEMDEEFAYFASARGSASAQPNRNRIVYAFQQDVLFARENEAFAGDAAMRGRLVANREKYLGRPVCEITDAELLRGFGISGLMKGYSRFSPLWAKYFAERTGCRSVADPFGGWGDRMIGFAAAGVKYSYNDLSAPTAENARRMNDRFGWGFDVSSSDAGDYALPEGCDAVFTCPPYGMLERYPCDEGGWNFGDADGWSALMERVAGNWLGSGARLLGVVIREDMVAPFMNVAGGLLSWSEPVNGKAGHLPGRLRRRTERMYVFDKLREGSLPLKS